MKAKPPKEELTSKNSPGKENMENARIEEEKVYLYTSPIMINKITPLVDKLLVKKFTNV